MQLYMLK